MPSYLFGPIGGFVALGAYANRFLKILLTSISAVGYCLWSNLNGK